LLFVLGSVEIALLLLCEDRKRRLGADADQPHRIKYRRIDA
jgi:hypothetical protein